MFEEMKEFYFPTKVISGMGVLSQVGKAALDLGMKKPMIVTDKGIIKAGIVQGALDVLQEAGLEYHVFDGIVPDPDNQLIDDMAKEAAQHKCDSFIGLGGGSSMDAAKLANIVLTHGGSIVDYARNKEIPGPLFPLIAIPTTAGTGSEVTRFAVVTDVERKLKKGIASYYNYPNLALIDYELIAKQPPTIAASTGMDALTHAIEGFTCLRAQPISDALALHAIKLIGENIRTLSAGKGDLAAAKGMALGSALAGMAFSNSSVGLVHAMSQAAGSLCGVPHGVGNSILLPYIMEFNLISSLDRFSQVAQALGEDIRGKTKRDAAQAASDAVRRLNSDVGIPSRLGLVGVSLDNVEELASISELNVNGLLLNPRHVRREDIIAIFKASI